MKFNQISENKWVSDVQAYSAAMLNSDREPIGIEEPRFTIEKGELKGKTVYRVREQHLGRKEVVGRYKTLEQAIKAIAK